MINNNFYRTTKPNDYPHRTNELRTLLKSYLKKNHIKMKPVMNSILNSLSINRPISNRQLEVVIPYIRNNLSDHSIEQIKDLFSVCVYDMISVSDYDYLDKYYPKILEQKLKDEEPNTLEPFYQ